MDNVQYLFAANAAFWAGLAGYIFFLARRQTWLEQRMQHLEAVGNEHDNSAV